MSGNRRVVIVLVFLIPRDKSGEIRPYSETSNSGLSQIWTQYHKPLYKGYDLRSQYNSYNAFEPPKEEKLSAKNKSVEFMMSPKCPLFGDSTSVFFCDIALRCCQTHVQWAPLVRTHWEEKALSSLLRCPHFGGWRCTN